MTIPELYELFIHNPKVQPTAETALAVRFSLP